MDYYVPACTAAAKPAVAAVKPLGGAVGAPKFNTRTWKMTRGGADTSTLTTASRLKAANAPRIKPQGINIYLSKYPALARSAAAADAVRVGLKAKSCSTNTPRLLVCNLSIGFRNISVQNSRHIHLTTSSGSVTRSRSRSNLRKFVWTRRISLMQQCSSQLVCGG